MARKNFIANLDLYIEWLHKMLKPVLGTTARINVTEKYARRKLKIKKDQPTTYRGLILICLGSHAWRQEQQYARNKVGK